MKATTSTRPRRKKSNSELYTELFSSSEKWCRWLSKNHKKHEGVWLRFYKKDSKVKSLAHAEAFDEALCCGWIDGPGKSYDDKSWLVKFTLRRQKGIWSKRNREDAERLNAEKRLKLPD